MNLSSAPFLPAPRRSPWMREPEPEIFVQPQSWRNLPRKRAAERDEEIIRAIRPFRRPVRFVEIQRKVKQSRRYLADRLRVMCEDGRLLRELYDDQHYTYRLAP